MIIMSDREKASYLCEDVYRRSPTQQGLVVTSAPDEKPISGDLKPLEASVLELPTELKTTKEGADPVGFVYDDANGFVARVVKDGNRYWIAFRGTDLADSYFYVIKNSLAMLSGAQDPSRLADYGDARADIDLGMGSCLPGTQLADALTLTQAVQKYAQATNPSASVILCGQSLGGGLATCVAGITGLSAYVEDPAPFKNSLLNYAFLEACREQGIGANTVFQSDDGTRYNIDDALSMMGDGNKAHGTLVECFENMYPQKDDNDIEDLIFDLGQRTDALNEDYITNLSRVDSECMNGEALNSGEPFPTLLGFASSSFNPRVSEDCGLGAILDAGALHSPALYNLAVATDESDGGRFSQLMRTDGSFRYALIDNSNISTPSGADRVDPITSPSRMVADGSDPAIFYDGMYRSFMGDQIFYNQVMAYFGQTLTAGAAASGMDTGDAPGTLHQALVDASFAVVKTSLDEAGAKLMGKIPLHAVSDVGGSYVEVDLADAQVPGADAASITGLPAGDFTGFGAYVSGLVATTQGTYDDGVQPPTPMIPGIGAFGRVVVQACANGGLDYVLADGGPTLVIGGSQSNVITGHDQSSGYDILVGGAGNDTFKPGRDEVVVGGGGRDAVDFSTSDTACQVPVQVDLGTRLTGGSGQGAAQGDVFFGISDVVGTNGDDTLKGDEGDNVLRGGGSGISGDTFVWSGGHDTFDATGGTGTADLSAAPRTGILGTSTGYDVHLGASGTTGDDADHGTITDFTENNVATLVNVGTILGSAFDDTLHLDPCTLSTHVDGKGGFNTVTFDGKRGDYQVTSDSNGGFNVVGDDITSDVDEFQSFVFSDQTLSAAALLAPTHASINGLNPISGSPSSAASVREGEMRLAALPTGQTDTNGTWSTLGQTVGNVDVAFGNVDDVVSYALDETYASSNDYVLTQNGALSIKSGISYDPDGWFSSLAGAVRNGLGWVFDRFGNVTSPATSASPASTFADTPNEVHVIATDATTGVSAPETFYVPDEDVPLGVVLTPTTGNVDQSETDTQGVKLADIGFIGSQAALTPFVTTDAPDLFEVRQGESGQELWLRAGVDLSSTAGLTTTLTATTVLGDEAQATFTQDEVPFVQATVDLSGMQNPVMPGQSFSLGSFVVRPGSEKVTGVTLTGDLARVATLADLGDDGQGDHTYEVDPKSNTQLPASYDHDVTVTGSVRVTTATEQTDTDTSIDVSQVERPWIDTSEISGVQLWPGAAAAYEGQPFATVRISNPSGLTDTVTLTGDLAKVATMVDEGNDGYGTESYGVILDASGVLPGSYDHDTTVSGSVAVTTVAGETDADASLTVAPVDRPYVDTSSLTYASQNVAQGGPLGYVFVYEDAGLSDTVTLTGDLANVASLTDPQSDGYGDEWFVVTPRDGATFPLSYDDQVTIGGGLRVTTAFGDTDVDATTTFQPLQRPVIDASNLDAQTQTWPYSAFYGRQPFTTITVSDTSGLSDTVTLTGDLGKIASLVDQGSSGYGQETYGVVLNDGAIIPKSYDVDAIVTGEVSVVTSVGTTTADASIDLGQTQRPAIDTSALAYASQTGPVGGYLGQIQVSDPSGLTDTVSLTGDLADVADLALEFSDGYGNDIYGVFLRPDQDLPVSYDSSETIRGGVSVATSAGETDADATTILQPLQRPYVDASGLYGLTLMPDVAEKAAGQVLATIRVSDESGLEDAVTITGDLGRDLALVDQGGDGHGTETYGVVLRQDASLPDSYDGDTYVSGFVVVTTAAGDTNLWDTIAIAPVHQPTIDASGLNGRFIDTSAKEDYAGQPFATVHVTNASGLEDAVTLQGDLSAIATLVDEGMDGTGSEAYGVVLKDDAQLPVDYDRATTITGKIAVATVAGETDADTSLVVDAAQKPDISTGLGYVTLRSSSPSDYAGQPFTSVRVTDHSGLTDAVALTGDLAKVASLVDQGGDGLGDEMYGVVLDEGAVLPVSYDHDTAITGGVSVTTAAGVSGIDATTTIQRAERPVIEGLYVTKVSASMLAANGGVVGYLNVSDASKLPDTVTLSGPLSDITDARKTYDDGVTQEFTLTLREGAQLPDVSTGDTYLSEDVSVRTAAGETKGVVGVTVTARPSIDTFEADHTRLRYDAPQTDGTSPFAFVQVTNYSDTPETLTMSGDLGSLATLVDEGEDGHGAEQYGFVFKPGAVLPTSYDHATALTGTLTATNGSGSSTAGVTVVVDAVPRPYIDQNELQESYASDDILATKGTGEPFAYVGIYDDYLNGAVTLSGDIAEIADLVDDGEATSNYKGYDLVLKQNARIALSPDHPTTITGEVRVVTAAGETDAPCFLSVPAATTGGTDHAPTGFTVTGQASLSEFEATSKAVAHLSSFQDPDPHDSDTAYVVRSDDPTNVVNLFSVDADGNLVYAGDGRPLPVGTIDVPVQLVDKSGKTMAQPQVVEVTVTPASAAVEDAFLASQIMRQANISPSIGLRNLQTAFQAMGITVTAVPGGTDGMTFAPGTVSVSTPSTVDLSGALKGTTGRDYEYATAPTNTFKGTSGSDILVGAGDDTVDYSGMTGNMTVDLGTKVPFSTAANEAYYNYWDNVRTGDVLIGIENVIGSKTGDSTFKGDGKANVFDGGDLNDTFVYSAGGDTYDGGGGINTLDLSGSSANASIDLSKGVVNVGGDAATTVRNVQVVQGTVGTDTFWDGAGNDTFISHGTNDVVHSSAGANTYGVDPTTLIDYSNSPSAIGLAPGGWNGNIQGSGGYAQGDVIETNDYWSYKPLNVVGSSKGDSLILYNYVEDVHLTENGGGNTFNDQIGGGTHVINVAGTGNRLTGGFGSDLFTVTGGDPGGVNDLDPGVDPYRDVMNFGSGYGILDFNTFGTVDLDFTTGRFTGTNPYAFNQGWFDLNDTYTGNLKEVDVRGGTVVATPGITRLVDDAGGGTLVASDSDTTLVANDYFDQVTTLVGGKGNDSLSTGYEGRYVLDAGDGTNTMTENHLSLYGETVNFVFDTPFVNDIINGFRETDTLDFKGGSFSSLNMNTVDQGDTAITTITGYGPGTVTLVGVDKSLFDKGAHMSFG